MQVFLVLSLIAVFFLILLILLPTFVISLFLGHRLEQPQHNSIEFGIESQQIALLTDDGLTLAAWRTYAESETPKGTVIILSGLQMPSVTAFFGYAHMLAEMGWDALLIEKRARSLSEGEEISFGIREWLDVKAGVDFLAADERAGALPIVAMGTSAGGATVIIAGGEIPRIDGVIAVSAYADFVELYVDSIPMFGLPRFLGRVTVPFMNWNLRARFGSDGLQYTPINGIERLGQRPILLMHSTEDWQVPFSHFERLYQTAEAGGISVSTFVREGDWHFVCYDAYVRNPAQDTAFSQAILAFLQQFHD